MPDKGMRRNASVAKVNKDGCCAIRFAAAEFTRLTITGNLLLVWQMTCSMSFLLLFLFEHWAFSVFKDGCQKLTGNINDWARSRGMKPFKPGGSVDF